MSLSRLDGSLEGRYIYVKYAGERLYHQRLLILKTTDKVLARMMKTTIRDSASVFWIMTPDGDVYPEDLSQYEDWFICNVNGSLPADRRGMQANRLHKFESSRRAGLPTPATFLRARSECIALEKSPRLQLQGELEDDGQWRLAASGKPFKTGNLTSVAVVGDFALGEDADGLYVLRRSSKSEADDAESNAAFPEPQKAGAGEQGKSGKGVAAGGGGTPEDDPDVRVLPVVWRGQRRRRRFADAIDEMEVVTFDDSPLDGEWSIDWFLTEIVRSGEGAVSRHHTWVEHSRIPRGDRSVHEHFCLSKILEYAIEVDQLNVFSLVSFEAIVRRMQVIEQAHADDPTNPDYSTADYMMGWEMQKGGALVAPALTKATAEKVREKSAMMKETRKHQEELKLRRKGKGPGKGKDKEAE